MAKQTELDPGARRFSMVYIHLSMHGNERGIGLTSGEILPWTELGDRLTDYSTRAGLIVQGTCLQTLCFSTCCGLYGRTMSIGKSISPFLAIVGSSQEVDWSDALTAFVAFYHSVPRPAISLAESVKRMNGAIGQHDLFELVCSDNVDSLADICCR